MESLKDIWEAAKVAGPFGTMLMLFVWLKTDKERRELQKKFDTLSESTLDMMNGVKESLRDVYMLLAGRKPNG